MAACLAMPDQDYAARDALVLEHMEFARTIAKKAKRIYRTPNVTMDDLEQLAYLGLIEAASRFDPRRGVPFRYFSQMRIIGAIHDAYRRGKFRDETHVCIDAISAARAEEDEEEEHVDPHPSPEVRLIKAQVLIWVDDLEAEFSPQELRMVRLRLRDGLTYPEVADVVGVRAHRVIEVCQRAMAALRRRRNFGSLLSAGDTQE